MHKGNLNTPSEDSQKIEFSVGDSPLPIGIENARLKVIMKCPYPACQKDYNDEDWDLVYNAYIDPDDFNYSKDMYETNRLYVISRRCRFCLQYFHEVYVGHENRSVYDEKTKVMTKQKPTLEFMFGYPSSKNKFESTSVPANVRSHFNEAERCRSVGSLTGTGACLRKTVYEVCDNLAVEGADYREKISNLPVKEGYKELLKHIKWLGDKTTKPGEETYTIEECDLALQILPVLVDELYSKDERVEKATKILSKIKQQEGQPKSGIQG